MLYLYFVLHMMIRNNIPLFFSLFFMITLKGAAQDTHPLKFDRITTENIKYEKGLSQNLVHSIVQDHRGFLWFGTWDGLNRYDGYTFKIFNEVNGLSNNTINTIVEDSRKQLWIGTENGINIMDLSSGNIRIMQNEPGNSNSISDNFISEIYIDADDHLWFCTSSGLNKYDKINRVISRYYFFTDESDSIQSNRINCIIQDDDKDMWIGTQYGLFCFVMSERVFMPYFHEPHNENSLSHNNVLSLFQDDKGFIWAGTQNGLNRFSKPSEKFKRYFHDYNDPRSLSNNRVNALLQDSMNQLWIGTADKLNLYDPTDDKFYHFAHTSRNTSLSNNNIYCLYEDGAHNLWIGTYNGASKLDRSSSKFTKYSRIPESGHPLSSNIIYDILKDDDLIWVGTISGLNRYERSTGKYYLIEHQINNNHNLADARVRSIMKSHKGIYWIGTEEYGLFRYDRQRNRFKQFLPEKGNPTSLVNERILYIMEDRTGRIWIGTANGLSILQPETLEFRNYTTDPKSEEGLIHNTVWSIYQDKKKGFWICTDGGLNFFDPDKKQWTRFSYDPQDPNSLNSNKIFSVFTDSDGEYWIGTMGGGLNHYNPATGDFTAFTESDGLASNVVYNIMEDEGGNLWMSTNWGLSKFSKHDTVFINYDIKDGLQGNEFNGNACYHAEDGEMFFGGMNGFNAFYPNEIGFNAIPPRVVITKFKKFNEVQPVNITNKDTLHLNHADNYFSFEFAALDFSNPAKNKYKYKLENYDKDWISRSADRRIAEYANVRPGTYTFRVIASNNDGVWNNEGTSLTIFITPPWWATWAFRIPFTLLIILGIWLIIYRRIKAIRKKHKVEKQMLNIEKQLFEIEQKALRLQMNPHFVFNSLNAIQSFVVSSDTDKAIHYLSKFSQLMRLILANSREANIPLREEIKTLTYFMDIEKLRFDNKFDYRIITDPEIDEEFIAIPPMIIQPYVENSILHGLINSPGKGKLRIEIKLVKDTIRVIIEDNGIGREASMKIKEVSGINRKSRGMMITKERLDLLNEQYKDKYSVRVIDLKDTYGKSSGTRVELIMAYQEI
ncbi:MAG: two-component regulator propeller domain-containing protein [Bacteroidales bacterium]